MKRRKRTNIDTNIPSSDEDAVTKISDLICKNCKKSIKKSIDDIFKNAFEEHKETNDPDIMFNALEKALKTAQQPYSRRAFDFFRYFYSDDINATYNWETGEQESDWQALSRDINEILRPSKVYPSVE